jgi:hypothetical protein
MGNTTLKHGNDYGEQPSGTVLLAAAEQVNSIFGNADRYIRSIGFTTSSGAVFGPWGDTDAGRGYSISGPVYGLYGGLWGDVLGSLGAWTTEPSSLPNGIQGVRRDGQVAGRSVLSADSASPQPTGTLPPSAPPPVPPSQRLFSTSLNNPGARISAAAAHTHPVPNWCRQRGLERWT